MVWLNTPQDETGHYEFVKSLISAQFSQLWALLSEKLIDLFKQLSNKLMSYFLNLKYVYKTFFRPEAGRRQKQNAISCPGPGPANFFYDFSPDCF